MLKILFIGDVVGKIGRKTLRQILPELKKELKVDLTIANAENISHGAGATEKAIKEAMEAGVDWFTCGDHSFDKKKQFSVYDNLPVLRPANYSAGVPGKGYSLISLGVSRRREKTRENSPTEKNEKEPRSRERKILLVNLIGRVFMKMDYDCPFRALDEILSANLEEKNISAII